MADSTNCLSTNVNDGLSKTAYLIILAMVYILFDASNVPTVLFAKPGHKCSCGPKHKILWPVRDVTLSCLVKMTIASPLLILTGNYLGLTQILKQAI